MINDLKYSVFVGSLLWRRADSSNYDWKYFLVWLVLHNILTTPPPKTAGIKPWLLHTNFTELHNMLNNLFTFPPKHHNVFS